MSPTPLVAVLDPSGRDWRPAVERSLGEVGVGVVREGPFLLAGPAAGMARQDAVTGVLAGELHCAPQEWRPVAAPAVLAAWARTGETALASLRGGWVFARLDAERGELVIARDQLGEQGLFWHAVGDRVVVATEAHLLLDLLPQRPAPDRASVAHWLARTTIPGTATVHEGVTRVAPGGLLRVDRRGGARAHRWWSPTRDPADPADAVERVRAAVELAVQRRTADAGVALLLSGGLDSSVVAGLRAPAEAGSGVRAYSLLFPAFAGLDETARIRALRNALGLEGVELTVGGGSFLRGVVEETVRWRVPVISPNVFYQRALARRMRADGMTALVDGEGGDELFSPARPLLADLLRRGRVRASWATTRRFPGAAAAPGLRPAWRFWRRHGLGDALPPAVVRARRAAAGRPAASSAWLRPDAAALVDEVAADLAWRAGGGPLWWRYLHWANAANYEALGAHEHFRHRAEGAGMRARHPLRDVDLLELVLSLPPGLAWDPGLDRPLLRAAVAGVVPEAVRTHGTKARFDALFAHVVIAEGRIIRRLLARPDAEVRGWIDGTALQARLLGTDPPRHPRGIGGWTEDAFRLTVMELWLRAEGDPDAPARLLAGEPLLADDLGFQPPR